MKLKNKKTGAIYSIEDIDLGNNADGIWLGMTHYGSLAELNEEWEDAPEEPKEHWCITMYGGIICIKDDEEPIDELIEIGNYFNSKEDAYDAWDKLKAWKRLKGGGFEFMSCSYGHDKTTDDTGGWIRFRVNHLYDDRYSCEVEKDLDLLFGGEE